MVSFFGHTVPCINTTTLISEIGNAISQDYPFAMMYFDTEDKRIYSLRSSENGIDVSEIAKKMGGGGHFNAAGFSTGLNSVLINKINPLPEGYPSAFKFDEDVPLQQELIRKSDSVTSEECGSGDYYEHYDVKF